MNFTQIKKLKPRKNKRSFRFCTFNVHMFTDYKNEISFDEIFNDIEKINADLIVLEEALFFKIDKKRFVDKVDSLKYNYYMCNNKYGINVILSKLPLCDVKVIKLNKGKINRYAIKTTIKINNVDFEVIGCHLDVSDDTENLRVEQMKTILSNCTTDNIIILGDLNSVNKNDYTNDEWNEMVNSDLTRKVITQNKLSEFMENNNFIDSFKLAKKDPPKISVWSNRRVDYIYIKSKEIKKISSYVYPTLSSDHYPIIADF